MGRILRRVPMDFEWPIGKTWDGYLEEDGQGPPRGEEELAEWLSESGASAMGGKGATYDEWLGMIGAGVAPVAAISRKGVQSGVAGVSKRYSK